MDVTVGSFGTLITTVEVFYRKIPRACGRKRLDEIYSYGDSYAWIPAAEGQDQELGKLLKANEMAVDLFLMDNSEI
jgi:hypothetical protein